MVSPLNLHLDSLVFSRGGVSNPLKISRTIGRVNMKISITCQGPYRQRLHWVGLKIRFGPKSRFELRFLFTCWCPFYVCLDDR